MNWGTCKTILFVDSENAGTIDLSEIASDVFVPFFFGISQKRVTTRFLKGALELGDRFKHIDIVGQGKNALDFHIAFYLGEFLAAQPQAECIILSGDKGFDPLVKHLCARGFSVRRSESVTDAFGAGATRTGAEPADVPIVTSKSKADKAPSHNYQLALELLRTMPARSRPLKRERLIAHLHNHFAKKVTEPELRRIVSQMIAEKKVSENAGKLGYHL